MSPETIYTLIFAAVCIAFSLIALAVVLRSTPQDTDPNDLRTQLLSGESVEHRIDAATREAEAGYTLCRGCEFENFKRFAHCSLCGEKLSTEAASASAGDGTGNSSNDDGDGNGDDHSRERLSGDVSQSTAPLAQLTPAQIRARRRKEWTRKLDVDGNMFWYRGCVNGIGSQFPGLAVLFSHPQTDGKDSSQEQTLEQTQTPTQTLQQTTAAAVTTTLVATASAVATSVLNADELIKMELVASADANPAVFPTGGTLGSKERMNEVTELVTRDFPTKYAHFVVSTASLIVPAEVEFLKLSVHREFLLEESVDHLSCIQQANIRSFMRITFLDESGVDAGGVHREWFMLVNEMLLAPALRLFVCTNKSEQAFYLNPHSAHDVGEDHLTYYFSTGRLVGRALLEGGVWGFHLALPLIKIILGIPVTFSDLEYLDPEAYRSMVWLLEHSDVDALGLDFSVTEQRSDGHVVVVDLVPNGRDVAVTDANKREYLDRKMRYLLFESVSSQLYVFLKGLYEVIPQELLMLFDAEEFDYLLCGTQEIDVDDWRANTVTTVNLNGSSVVRWFWEVVREMPNEYRRRLLLFATGSSRVPLSGFAGLTSYDGRLCPFTLKGVSYYATQYISSHACFNRLELPLYRSKLELKTVLLATLETDQYGFTTA